MAVKIPPRWIVHHDHDGWWTTHEITPHCKKIDPSLKSCRPSAGFISSTGLRNDGLQRLIAVAHDEATWRRTRFRDEMQSRGKALK